MNDDGSISWSAMAILIGGAIFLYLMTTTW